MSERKVAKAPEEEIEGDTSTGTEEIEFLREKIARMENDYHYVKLTTAKAAAVGIVVSFSVVGVACFAKALIDRYAGGDS